MPVDNALLLQIKEDWNKNNQTGKYKSSSTEENTAGSEVGSGSSRRWHWMLTGSVVCTGDTGTEMRVKRRNELGEALQ